MKITSIGHESWFLDAGGEGILVDPILGDSFGSCPVRQFTFLPDRCVDVEMMPKVSVIIFTTEHLQHFSPITLREISRVQSSSGITIFIPELFPASAEKIINELNFRCVRVDIGDWISIGAARFRYYMPKSDVLFWDARVASLYLEDSAEAFFIQSDTAISADFFDDVVKGKVVRPTLLVVTNNFQRSGAGESLGLDNLLPIPDERLARAAGLRLLEGLVSAPHRKLGYTPHILISGNGYMNHYKTLDHIWSNEELAGIAQELSILGKIFSLNPGERYCSTSSDLEVADWILRKCNRDADSVSRWRPSKNNGALDLNSIKQQLDVMAKSWLITDYGKILLAQNEYLGKPTGSKRLAIVLTEENAQFTFVLDISKVSFELIESEEDSIRKYPFGIVVDYQDFSDLLSGRMQIWEILNLSASQWYVCGRYQSPLAFWLEYFNEQVDNARAYGSYIRSLEAPTAIS